MSNKPPINPPDMQFLPGSEPVYTNLARITHSPSEFVIDLARLLPGDATALIQARVIMSPLSLKLFQRALSDNLAKYEANFGEITIPGGTTLADVLFRPPSSKE